MLNAILGFERPDQIELDYIQRCFDLQMGLVKQVREDGASLLQEWFGMPDREEAEALAIMHFAERMKQMLGANRDHRHELSITLHDRCASFKYRFTDRDTKFPTIRRLENYEFRPDRPETEGAET